MLLDGSVLEELLNVRIVEQILVLVSCIFKRVDILNWFYLRDVDLLELSVLDVGFIIGLKEKFLLFVLLECKLGGYGELVVV